MPTTASILTAIGQIITGAKYKANQMRPLLQNIFNVSSSFYVGNLNPGASNDNTQNFRAGSLGRNAANGRLFLCRDATTGAAVWQQISQDFLVVSTAMVEGGTSTLGETTSQLNLSGTVNDYNVILPPNPYPGKPVTIKMTGTASGDFSVINPVGGGVVFNNPVQPDDSIVFIALNDGTYAWTIFSRP